LIAHDGEAALSEAERSRPEVALVDLELPAIDGLEVALDCARATASRSGLSPTRLGRTTPRRIPRRQTLASTMCSSSRPRSIRLSRPFSTAADSPRCDPLVDWAGKFAASAIPTAARQVKAPGESHIANRASTLSLAGKLAAGIWCHECAQSEMSACPICGSSTAASIQVGDASKCRTSTGMNRSALRFTAASTSGGGRFSSAVIR